MSEEDLVIENEPDAVFGAFKPVKVREIDVLKFEIVCGEGAVEISDDESGRIFEIDEDEWAFGGGNDGRIFIDAYEIEAPIVEIGEVRRNLRFVGRQIEEGLSEGWGMEDNFSRSAVEIEELLVGEIERGGG